MSANQINIKPNKHKIYQCPKSKKLSLLNYLLEQNKNNSIAIISSNATNLKLEGITLLSDEELATSTASYELIISYDLPSDAEIYIKRVQKATQGAFILLDIEEQKELYPIETILGRAIKQESLVGFEYEVKKEKLFDKPKQITQDKKKPFVKSSYSNPRQDGEKKSFDKPKKWDSKEAKPFDKPKNFKKDDKPKKWDKPKQNNIKPKENQKEPKEIKPIRKIVIKKPKP